MAEDRFARTAATIAGAQDRVAAQLEREVLEFVRPSGDERALDAGCGAGALALALAPHVREVVGVDRVPELLDEARKRAPANATFVEGDVAQLTLESFSFDLVGSRRVLHHARRPELVVAELARVTRPGGHLLVIDQLGDENSLVSLELDRFERARDPGHTRLLPENDLRALFEANNLVLLRSQVHREERDVDAYLDYAGCEGEERERARALAPHGYHHVVGWFLLRRA
jgi:ubiquinone/menaquinone biosynthesis C-methylase UbiE